MKAALLLLPLLVSLAFSLPSQLSYQVGDEYVYFLSALLDARGQIVDSDARTSGSFSTMNSTLVTQCTDEDDYSYYFVMNMFNTEVDVGQSAQAPSLVGQDDGLGDDVYYQVNKTGGVVQIWYEEDDSPYFVNVKIGAINAFQTYFVASGESQTVLESDPVGVHYSVFTGADGEDDGLVISKTFNQLDFRSFPDTDLHPSNVIITASTVTTIHNDGYVLSSVVNQEVNLVDITPSSSSSSFGAEKASDIDDGDDSAVNMTMSSKGTLTITFSPDSAKVYKLNAKKISQVKASGNYIGDTAFNIASTMLKKWKPTPYLNSSEVLEHILDASKSVKKDRLVKMMDKLVVLLNEKEESLELFDSSLAMISELEVTVRDRIFYVLSQVPAAEERFLQYGLLSSDIETKTMAIRSASFSRNPSRRLLSALWDIFQTESEHTVKIAALLAYGSASSRAQAPLPQEVGHNLLRLVNPMRNEDELVALVHAIGNAGPKAIPISRFPVDLLGHSSQRVQKATINALKRKYSTEPKVQRIFKILESVEIESSDFPFNKSYVKDINLGGKAAGVYFHGELFAGTNFDCNQEYFNYEGLAVVNASFSFLGYYSPAFIAEAIYGRENGSPLADELFLQVFHDVIYDQAIPQVDCSVHTYPLAHTAPGISVSYTVWISVIPVVFTAGISTSLDLDWGWEICDSQLLAMVELVPDATITVSGDAVIDLLIIQAGIDLSGAFNAELVPQAYIHGSECQVGFDVQEANQPMDITFESYYAWKSCKYWIFDCHWKEHNTQTWFSWDLPAQNYVLFDQSWPIQP